MKCLTVCLSINDSMCNLSIRSLLFLLLGPTLTTGTKREDEYISRTTIIIIVVAAILVLIVIIVVFIAVAVHRVRG